MVLPEMSGYWMKRPGVPARADPAGQANASAARRIRVFRMENSGEGPRGRASVYTAPDWGGYSDVRTAGPPGPASADARAPASEASSPARADQASAPA